MTKKPTGAEIRQTFIDFFVEHGHTAVPSASLVPGGDSTLLFTNSGMVQFKDVFIGTDKRPYTRAVDSQKCMRVAGKHNDLEDVGRDGTHHTFFEMLGNWSFGDYYKKEAIEWAWQLLTDVWGLEKNRLYSTVFKDELGEIPTDEEAAGHWRDQPGYDPGHLFYMGRKDNFWEMAETGPCGPCSEIHYDLRPGEGPVNEQILDTDRFVELWNLVFMQYNRLGPTHLEPLPATHVDTGMGFERLVSILQGVDSNYKTDLFTESLGMLRSLTGHSEEEMLANFTPYRVICDHARSAAFLIADGVVPGNVGRNYICRMIIRRAARFGTKLGLTEPFLAQVAEGVIETYADFYPELEKSRRAILDNLTREEIRFARTVETGTAYLQNLLDEVRAERSDEPSEERSRSAVLDGHKAFDLYATYGLPFEITRDIAREQDLDVDEAGFRAAMDEHRIASGGGKAMGALGGEDAEFYAGVLKALQADKKLGPEGVEYDPYASTRLEGDVLALVVDGKVVDSASFGDTVEVILPKTGFYIESGGQVSDTGYIKSLAPLRLSPNSGNLGGEKEGGWEIEVTDMRKPSTGIIVHQGEVVSGKPKVGDKALAQVDMQRRHDIMRNHTATHLLHAALHQVLGDMARQAGSLVAPDRLRFDFTYPEAMKPEQIERVEKIVNDAVAADMAVQPKLKPREEAIKEGAMALFGEKYGDTVRTLTIADGSPGSEIPEEQGAKYSYELCGGTHLDRTSDMGAFLITSEGSAAAGIRRIEAVTGRGAYELIARRFKALKSAASMLKSSLDEVPLKIESVLEDLAATKKQAGNMRRQFINLEVKEQLKKSKESNQVGAINLNMSPDEPTWSFTRIGDTPLLVANFPDADQESLRSAIDIFKEEYPFGVAVLASGTHNSLVASSTDSEIDARELIRYIAVPLGGSGGGKPTLAQAGGKDMSNLGRVLASVSQWVEEKLKSSTKSKEIDSK